jgi:hypothetical protein
MERIKEVVEDIRDSQARENVEEENADCIGSSNDLKRLHMVVETVHQKVPVGQNKDRHDTNGANGKKEE